MSVMASFFVVSADCWQAAINTELSIKITHQKIVTFRIAVPPYSIHMSWQEIGL
jgi:hypothetical protein